MSTASGAIGTGEQASPQRKTGIFTYSSSYKCHPNTRVTSRISLAVLYDDSVIEIQTNLVPHWSSVVIKVGMVGDSAIGKTSLMVKYVEGAFDEDYIQTLGFFRPSRFPKV